ncbi:hypothetical protein AX15_000449 [Amanita polypyramis BW_CC]|nr:hypothetical protein AX15_000449 [Amanita polypyramis BW_CC]
MGAGERDERSLDCGMFVLGRGEPGLGTIDGGASSLCLQCTRRKAREVERAEWVRESQAKEKGRASGENSVERCEREMDVVGSKDKHASLPTASHLTVRRMMYPEYISLSSLQVLLQE